MGRARGLSILRYCFLSTWSSRSPKRGPCSGRQDEKVVQEREKEDAVLRALSAGPVL